MRKINHNFRSFLIGFFSQAVVVHHEYNKCWLSKQDSITSPPTIIQRSCQGFVGHRFFSSLSLSATNVTLKATWFLQIHPIRLGRQGWQDRKRDMKNKRDTRYKTKRASIWTFKKSQMWLSDIVFKLRILEINIFFPHSQTSRGWSYRFIDNYDNYECN